ncbi:hypothetical protein RBG61_09380 [Paludicola sp. MB14-C6]|uniref:hypothetical protein n=1 Tax=Paludihabitans sp. MB14-C6 TaxID=3070656 RepID=UPI0027DB9BCA|nr:hypothetical protein [Paludicola sp. MB14-C6]WMJ22208.1 hypothetical protein RBG61_09380 [Paludicola sp. MB14-C6]
MFGLTFKETISNAIINASRNNIELYKSLIKSNIDKLTCSSEEETIKILTNIRREYLDNVSNEVINSFKISSPPIAMRINLALLSPSISGYEDINIDNGLMAGSLFAICYYGVKNAKAKPKDCIKLNHLQNDIIERALVEIDEKV